MGNPFRNAPSRIFRRDHAEWRAFFEAEAPQVAALPGVWDSRATPFQRLLLLKVFRPEKVSFGTVEFVGAELGSSFKESPPFDLQSTFADSACKVPIIFVIFCRQRVV